MEASLFWLIHGVFIEIYQQCQHSIAESSKLLKTVHEYHNEGKTANIKATYINT